MPVLTCVGGPCDGRRVEVDDHQVHGDFVQVIEQVRESESVTSLLGDMTGRCPICNADDEEKRKDRCRLGCSLSSYLLSNATAVSLRTHIYIIDSIRTTDARIRVVYDVVRFLRYYGMTSEQAIRHQFSK